VRAGRRAQLVEALGTALAADLGERVDLALAADHEVVHGAVAGEVVLLGVRRELDRALGGAAECGEALGVRARRRWRWRLAPARRSE